MTNKRIDLKMSDMDELTRLAVEELMKEGAEFVKKRDVRYVEEPAAKKMTLKPNKTFLRNTVKHLMASNRFKEKKRNMKRADSAALPGKHLESKEGKK